MVKTLKVGKLVKTTEEVADATEQNSTSLRSICERKGVDFSAGFVTHDVSGTHPEMRGGFRFKVESFWRAESDE